MRFTVAAVGRMRGDPSAALFERYRKRLRAALVLKEVEVNAGPARARREGERLLAAVPVGAVVVVLDETGEMLASEELARRLAGWRNSGRRDCAFLIGGAEGHAAAVCARADLLLSLGAMTWPHLLVRAMLAEQLYRAETILADHPYHRASQRSALRCGAGSKRSRAADIASRTPAQVAAQFGRARKDR